MSTEGMAAFRPSPQQERLWLSRAEPSSARAQARIEIEGPLDRGRLDAALEEVVRRHEILRTTFHERPGLRIPLQVIGEHPVLESELTELGADRHTLRLSLPAMCADAGSFAVLFEDLAAAYQGEALAGEPLQYADFAQWRHELLEVHEDANAAPVPPVPVLPFARGAGERARVGRVEVALRGGYTKRALLAAWVALIARLSGSEAFTVGVLDDGRDDEELAGMAGPSATLAAVPVSLAPNDTLEALAATLDGRLRDAVAKAARTAVDPEQRLQVGFEWRRLPAPRELQGARFTLRDVEVDGEPFALALIAAGQDEDLRAWLQFEQSVFGEQVVCAFADELAQLLRSAAAEPGAPLHALDLLDAGSHRRLVIERNRTEAELPAATVQELFEEQARVHAGRVALVCGETALTYGELDARASQLARHLRGLGIGPQVIVGLLLPRCAEAIVAMLAVLKAGGAYLPLSVEHPQLRVERQLKDADAAAVVTHERYLSRVSGFDGARVCPDRDAEALAALEGSPLASAADPEQLAYVIYTSGSSGAPKGVGIHHRALANYALHMRSRVAHPAGSPASFALVSTLSTDLGNTAIYAALTGGGCLHVIEDEVTMDGALYGAYCERQPIDVLKITPSHLRMLLGSGGTAVLPRRTLILGGEPCPWELADLATREGCEVINHYGPTETTVGSLTFTVADGHPARMTAATVPIGLPISNTAAYVLDEGGGPSAVGVPGELYIGGAGVARGYLNAAAEIGSRFVELRLPDGAVVGRVYRTGDLVRNLPSGEIEFLGRADDQVKVRGFRVEPAEIEMALCEHPLVDQATIVVREEGPGEHRLIAYLVSAGEAPSAEELRGHLRALLPEHMLPGGFVVLEQLPLTPSGKLDRAALPAPEITSGTGEHEPPRGADEQAIAKMWSELLGLERVGREDDFFALGGHSLLATQVVAWVRTTLDVPLPLGALFDAPTVAGLAQAIAAARGEQEDPETEALLAELEQLSDEEVETLLKLDEPVGEEG